MPLASLQAALRGVRRISLDTSIFLAQASAADPRQGCARWLLDEVERGRFECTISAVSAAEMLVRPSRGTVHDAVTAQAALRNFPHLRVEAFTLDAAVDAAHVRAVTELRLPDAIILAVALAARVDAIVHADDDWDAKTATYGRALRIVNLNRFCP